VSYSLANLRLKNILLLALLGAVGVGLLVWEGYLFKVRLPLVLLMGVMVLFDVWVAGFEISFRRLLFLSAVAGVAGYVTQVVGVGQGFWYYTGPRQSYLFVPFIFAFAALCMYGLTTKLFGRLLQPLVNTEARWPNLLIVCVLFGLLLATVTHPLAQIGWAFWIYYLFLFLFGLFVSLQMNCSTLLGLISSAWIVGGSGETLGAQSGLWLYENASASPPLFLILTSWPLEFLLHYSMSGLLAQEKL
jgi:hypothetical protein